MTFKLAFSFIISFFIFIPEGTINRVEKLDAEMAVCHDVDGMEAFVRDLDFVNIHQIPEQINFKGSGEMIQLDVANDVAANAYFLPAKKDSNRWLFVYQEWWGLNDQIKQEADKLHADLEGKVNVIAIDMYDGEVTSDRNVAGKLMGSRDNDRLEGIVNGAVSFAGNDAKIANIGWCFGGGWSLKSALLGGKQTVGSVMYYGMPVKDVNKLKTLNSDVLGLFATEKWISKEVIEEFAANMKAAGKKLDYTIYDAVHGFSNPSNPKHDPVATKDAYGKALEYLKARLDV